MPEAYRLPCPRCQTPQTIVPQQAGQSVPCAACGEVFFAPSYRELRRLPLADDGGETAARPRRGTTRAIDRERSRRVTGVTLIALGLFSLVGTLATAGTSAWLRTGLRTERPELFVTADQEEYIRNLSPRAAYQTFQAMASVDLETRPQPLYLRDRLRDALYTKVMISGLVGAGIAVVILGAGAMMVRAGR